MAIIIVERGTKARRLEREVIAQEDYLQQYVHENPDTLPLHEFKADVKLLVVSREFPTGSGPIDALAVDADGDIYIIETKLYKNPDKRRVIAQMLDYGAALWSAGSHAFFEELGDADFESRLTEAFALDESEAAVAVAAMSSNVEAGCIQFVVLMDRIDERLKALISYVNASSRFTILGVELDFYKDGGRDILIPRLYGAEGKRQDDASPERRAKLRWSEGSYFEAATTNLTDEQLNAVRHVYDWGRREAQVRFASGLKGGFTLNFPELGGLRLLKIRTDGTIVVRVSQHGELGASFRDALNASGLVTLAPDAKKPSISASEWVPRWREFLGTVESFIEKQRERKSAG